MSEWQLITTLPKRNWLEEGIECLVTDGRSVHVASRACVFPDGSICGSLPSHNGRMTDWGITHWMPLPDPPTGERGD